MDHVRSEHTSLSSLIMPSITISKERKSPRRPKHCLPACLFDPIINVSCMRPYLLTNRPDHIIICPCVLSDPNHHLSLHACADTRAGQSTGVVGSSIGTAAGGGGGAAPGRASRDRRTAVVPRSYRTPSACRLTNGLGVEFYLPVPVLYSTRTSTIISPHLINKGRRTYGW